MISIVKNIPCIKQIDRLELEYIFKITCAPSQDSDQPVHVLLAPVAQSVECPLWGTGGHGFDPLIKSGTRYSSLGAQTYGIELGLVDPVSG